MFAAYRNPARTYAGVAVETSVAVAEPAELVVLLYAGAIEAITKAIGHMSQHDHAAKGHQVTRAIRIIDEGLLASLDSRGGELTDNLRGLYEYMSMRLLQGSMKNDPEILAEVRNLLADVKGAWDELARTGRAAPAPAARLAA